MKNGQKLNITVNGRVYKYKVAMQSDLNNGVWIQTLRGKKKFLLNVETLTWNENGTNLTAEKIELL